MRRLYRRALADTAAIVSMPSPRSDRLRAWLGPAARVVFLPFGVDVNAFRPVERRARHRRRLRRRRSPPGFRAAPARGGAAPGATRSNRRLGRACACAPTAAERRRSKRTSPSTRCGTVSRRRASLRYRCARTATRGRRRRCYRRMALAKPVVVSRTEAIAAGYELEDGVNCRLVEPGDGTAFERAILEMLTGADAAAAIGIRARQTVVRSSHLGALYERALGARVRLALHLQHEARGGVGAERVVDL